MIGILMSGKPLKDQQMDDSRKVKISVLGFLLRKRQTTKAEQKSYFEKNKKKLRPIIWSWWLTDDFYTELVSNIEQNFNFVVGVVRRLPGFNGIRKQKRMLIDKLQAVYGTIRILNPPIRYFPLKKVIYVESYINKIMKNIT